jgi:hypothetical protein
MQQQATCNGRPPLVEQVQWYRRLLVGDAERIGKILTTNQLLNIMMQMIKARRRAARRFTRSLSSR